MPDIFDQIAPDQQHAPAPAKADIFDSVAVQQPTAQTQPKPPESSFFDNLGNSAVNFVASVPAGIAAAGNAIMHPVDTVEGLSSVGGGLVAKGARALGINVPGKGGEDDQRASAVLDALKQRYGGMDAIKHTAYTDPVGLAADASMLLGGGSAALKAGMGLTKTARLMKAADVISGLSDAINPLLAPKNALKAASAGVDAAGAAATNMGMNGTGAALSSAAQTIKQPLKWAKNAAARDIYQSAVRPPPSMGADTQRAVVDTGLANGIPANEQAPAKAQKLWKDAANRVQAKLASSPDQIDPNQVAAVAQQARPSLTSVDPSSDRAAFDATIQRYLDEHTPPAQPPPQAPAPSGLVGPNGQPLPAPPAPAAPPPPTPQPYPVQQGQAEKTNTYKKIGDNQYGDQSGAQVEAMKGLARGLRQSIEQFFPEVAEDNKVQANGMALEEAMNRFVANEGNRGTLMQFFRPSVASGVALGAVGAESHSPALALGAHLVTKALEDPGVRSRIGIALYKSANNPGSPVIRRTLSPLARIAEVQSEVSHPAVVSGALVNSQQNQPDPQE